ncbi:TetR/AcrR family transcriptional regulator [Paenibacillus sp. GCM10023250]|uniref:TetR/AcrR family transcriptional regulator n=1 Tax=Paenibacillus sp. GCM10023250 TaxID=3252648 RepID=UPI00361F5EE8
MPPKAEITKESVLNAAFDLVREEGLEGLTTRRVARRLNCSTQPIYSVYGSMEAVKADVFDRAVRFALARIETYENANNEPVMNMAIGCLLFAKHEKRLFRAIFLSEYGAYDNNKLYEAMRAAFLQLDGRFGGMEEARLRRLFLKLAMFWIGMGAMINAGALELDVEEATKMIEEMYEALQAQEGLA